jgi:hypothetical protein
MYRYGLSCLLVVLLFGRGFCADKPLPADVEFFEKQVRPLLAERCLECHDNANHKGKLRLTSRANLLKGGSSGTVVVPGKPEGSLLITAIRYNDKPQMPPKAKLSDREIAILTRWVKLGVPWPDDGKEQPIVQGSKFRITDEQRQFWSFQPVKAGAPPAVKDTVWPKSGVDRYILAALEGKGLKPAKPADKRTLIRRATFDLTGLPPTPAEIDAFLRDTSPAAFAKVVDRLLASPHYGERWGRHWLDLVRFTDSFDSRIVSGPGNEMDIPESWRYRDWVVNAFNRDLPYNRFVIDQIAGDLVPGNAGDVNVPGIIATGMLAIGDWGGGDADKEKLLTDIADDQVDVVSRAFMGLTVACARCHDHKFDPISTADYYGMAGIFFSTHILPNVGPKTNGPPTLRVPLASKADMEKRNQYQARLVALDNQLKAARDQHGRAFAKALRPHTARYLLAAWDYQHRPADLAKLSVDDFAGRHKLHGFALRQWLDYLGIGEYQLMTKAVRDVLGNRGVHAWKGEPDCPSATVNSTDKELKILTFTLPPRSISVHPGPTNGVVVAWQSPITGTVRIRGRLVDADAACGDGVAWIIDHRQTGGRRELASGDFANGGAQDFAKGKYANRLAAVEVKAGDRIELLVLPKDNHACDTTVVELVIATKDGKAVWNLAGDVVDDFHKSNPHADRLGHAAVWHFLDMASSNRAARPGGAVNPALAGWQRALADVAAGKADRGALEKTANDFQKTFTLDDARSPFWVNRVEDEKHLPAEARATLTKLAAELAELKKNPPPPLEYADAAQDGGVPGSPHDGVHDVRIHKRGRYDRLGELVPRRFPQILAGNRQKPITEGSGRLQLARWIASPDHPLTARVMVNRIWQHHFGEGLVRTPSNFGKLGERPTHPALLDYLAAEFVRSGWSIKKMHRLIMLSAVYQQSSQPSADDLKLDPDNRLLGRMNRRRLEAEAIRDSLLAVAGRLDHKLGGLALRDFNAPRRTLYQMTIRSDRSGFGPLFDVANPTALVDKRIASTVAPQALFLLNHPFVLRQTQSLAERIMASANDQRGRIDKAYQLLYGRLPSSEEREVGEALLKEGDEAKQAWLEYCQVLLCANEFIYVD